LKNERIRELMFRNMISQTELAEILMVSQAEVSVMLKHELADEEQDEIIAKINKWLEKQKKKKGA
jgi:predicted XRE-type DNA-binding protein